jgi:2-polyprenyl-3-methyl-5-hydroxy-6-metoxy-1,4-benzoquinol methylase
MNCILCKKSSLTKFTDSSYLNTPVYYCDNCNFYLNGDSEGEIGTKVQEIYKKEYWDSRRSETMLNSNYMDADSQGKKRRWLSQYAYCKKFFQGKKILEIGAGSGQALFWFEKEGFFVTGIEPDKRNVDMINKKLEYGKCFAEFVEDLQMDKKFDVIWISHAMEHLVRPDLLLEKCKNNLNDEGILFIEVPNCENDTILKLSIYDNPSTFHFSMKSLLTMAKTVGYDVLQRDYFRSPHIIEGAINRILKRYFGFIKIYPYYPKIVTNNKDGTDIRMILKLAKQAN